MASPRLASDASMRDFLTALSSGEGAYGMVSASAVAAAMGTSLLLMVAALPKTRSDSIDDRTVLTGVATALSDVWEQLIETIETETAVKVFAARNMPRASETQRAERDAAIQLAMRAAGEVPLEIMRLCVLALTHARTVAGRGCRAASRDIETALALLRVGFTGAQSSLETKLTSLTDAVYTGEVVDEIARLSEQAGAAAHAAEVLVKTPPA